MKRKQPLKIDRHPVESSMMHSVGYDPKAKVMHIQFHNGGIYEYPDVEPEAHAALMASESKGKHFHQHLRKLTGKKLNTIAA